MADAVEAHIDIATSPLGRNGEVATVGTYRILLATRIGKPTGTFGHHAIGRLIIGEGIAGIAIEGLVPRLVVVQSPDLPAAGHIDIGPCGIIEILFKPLLLSAGRHAYPLELPNTIERLIVGRERHVVLRHSVVRGHGYG